MLGSASFATAASDSPVYLVVGASGGIGSAVAERIAKMQQGAKLVCADKDKEALSDLQSKMKDADFPNCDATNPQQVADVVSGVIEKYGRLDGVASCVGNVSSKAASSTTLDDLHSALRVNLDTAFNVLQESVKAMVKGGKGGSVVLISAAVAGAGIPNFEAMSAAKAGVEGLARSAAASYASQGVRVNCVAPGLTTTEQSSQFLHKDAVESASKDMHPSHRFARPADIASAVEFLLRPENSMITGQVLAVDGGLSALQPQPHKSAAAHNSK